MITFYENYFKADLVSEPESMLLNFDSSQVAKESIHMIKMKTDEGKGEKH